MSASALGRQFWKSNPNQMALPGLEEHSHPGAHLLAKGYTFVPYTANLGDDVHPQLQHELTAVHPDVSQGVRTFAGSHVDEHAAASLNWAGTGYRSMGEAPGEIGMVETSPEVTHRGLATALYGMGRQMARVKPRHSTSRTLEGDAWAKTTVAKYGGRVPKKNAIDED